MERIVSHANGKGTLAKYKLERSREMISSTPEWDAGTLLNAKSASRIEISMVNDEVLWGCYISK